MADDKDLLAERGRSLEAEYFRRKDKELLERAKEQHAAAERRGRLAAALGLDADDPAAAALTALGFDGETAPLLDIVPAVQVAWSDGTLPPKERAEIERLLSRPELQRAAQAGSSMMAEWLTRQPPRELYRAATDALKARAARLEGEARSRLVARIIDDCNAVASASGGVFGLGSLSSAEADQIRQLAAALGLKS
jgi:hypothetical protein